MKYDDYVSFHVDNPHPTDDVPMMAVDIVGQQQRKIVQALIDTGASNSHIRKSYAETLGLCFYKKPPQTFRMANGDRSTCDAVVELPLRLAPEAPTRLCTCWVHEKVPIGNYVLLGRDSLNGFAITLSSPPRLEWIQSTAIEDRADPVELRANRWATTVCACHGGTEPPATPAAATGDNGRAPWRQPLR